MFTGLIQDIGTIARVDHLGRASRLSVRTAMDLGDAELGESIAVNGACLTVVEVRGDTFAVDVSPETLDKTSAGRLAAGHEVHLERALRLADRLGGHLVLGHVDGVGTIVSRRAEANAVHLEISAPPEVARYLVPKGCIAVDGVSLTVNTCDERRFSVTIVPHTSAKTLLTRYGQGTTVNLEADVIGKYVAALVAPHRDGAGAGSGARDEALRQALVRGGFMGPGDGAGGT